MSAKKVIVGMSGGVDSSVAAALLLEKGYEVIGVTMHVWDGDLQILANEREDNCCSLSAVEDARKVADKLNIRHYVMNFKDIFKKKVIDYFVDDYLKGRTPNPCIACNKYVKFGALLDKAFSMDVDYVATGHYARVLYDNISDRFLLKKAITEEKDQSYALYNLTQEKLSKVIFPLGEYTKDDVRALARKYNLPVASKPDSQEICFIQDNNYSRFINDQINQEYKNLDKLKNNGTKPGYFVDTKGNKLGEHSGIIHYTVGQRKGLGITFGKPMYVVKVDSENNQVVLGGHDEVFSMELIATDVNYILVDNLLEPMKVESKIRYSAKESSSTLYPLESGKVKVVFDEPQRAITPGQSVVFYKNEVVVGGGIIES